jgi:hypothetical protein
MIYNVHTNNGYTPVYPTAMPLVSTWGFFYFPKSNGILSSSIFRYAMDWASGTVYPLFRRRYTILKNILFSSSDNSCKSGFGSVQQMEITINPPRPEDYHTDKTGYVTIHLPEIRYVQLF